MVDGVDCSILAVRALKWATVEGLDTWIAHVVLVRLTIQLMDWWFVGGGVSGNVGCVWNTKCVSRRSVYREKVIESVGIELDTWVSHVVQLSDGVVVVWFVRWDRCLGFDGVCVTVECK